MNSSLRLFPSALVAARAFSTKAVSHAPPKKIHGIPGRYAGAVYTAASKVNRIIVVQICMELLPISRSTRVPKCLIL